MKTDRDGSQNQHQRALVSGRNGSFLLNQLWGGRLICLAGAAADGKTARRPPLANEATDLKMPAARAIS